MWTPELCPYCKSRDLELIMTDEMGTEVNRDMVCASCQKKFTNSFKYQGYYTGNSGFILHTYPVKNVRMPTYERAQLEVMTMQQILNAQEEMYDWAVSNGLVRAVSQIACGWDQTADLDNNEYSYMSAGARWVANDDTVRFEKLNDGDVKLYLDTSQRLAVLQDWWVDLTFEFEESCLEDEKRKQSKKDKEVREEHIRRLDP